MRACPTHARPSRYARWPRSGWLLAALCAEMGTASVWSTRAAAQGTPSSGAKAIAVRGSVRTANTDVALSGAVIELSRGTTSVRARSDERGEFALASVPSGRYYVNVMRLGYLPFRDSVTIAENMPRIKVVLTGNVQELQAIAVRANVTAIYGGVGVASRYKNANNERELFPATNVTVHVLGSGRTATTDSIGRFFVELGKPGSYFVRLSAPGLKDEIYSVVVPKNTAVDASRLLDSSDTKPRVGYATLIGEMDRRIRIRGLNSAVVSGEELRESEMNIVDALLRSKSMVTRGMQIGGSTCVFIDGIPRPNFSIEGIRPEEVAAIELYGDGGDVSGTVGSSWPRGATCGTNNHLSPANSRAIPVARYALVWTVP